MMSSAHRFQNAFCVEDFDTRKKYPNSVHGRGHNVTPTPYGYFLNSHNIIFFDKTEEQTYENEVITYLLDSKMEKCIQCNMLCSCFCFNIFSRIAILNVLFEIQCLRKWLPFNTFKIHCKYQ